MVALNGVSLLKFLLGTRVSGQTKQSELSLKIIDFKELTLVSGGAKQAKLSTLGSPNGNW